MLLNGELIATDNAAWALIFCVPLALVTTTPPPPRGRAMVLRGVGLEEGSV